MAFCVAASTQTSVLWTWPCCTDTAANSTRNSRWVSPRGGMSRMQQGWAAGRCVTPRPSPTPAQVVLSLWTVHTHTACIITYLKWSYKKISSKTYRQSAPQTNTRLPLDRKTQRTEKPANSLDVFQKHSVFKMKLWEKYSNWKKGKKKLLWIMTESLKLMFRLKKQNQKKNKGGMLSFLFTVTVKLSRNAKK